MKNVIRILIVLLLLEVILGYMLYLRNSKRLTDNYISSTFRVINFISDQALFPQAQQELTHQAETRCKDQHNLNRELIISDINFYRRAIKLQTNIDFLNTSDISSKYIIFIAGNSEAYGSSQDMQKRIHVLLQEKLQNKFKSNDFIVLNISDFGHFLNDQFNSIQFFSKIYNPDLVIFYTGGNELSIQNFYEDMLPNQSLNIDNEYWYEFINKKPIYQECLDDKKFLTHLNFQENHASIDVSRYINDGFFDIQKHFDEINSDFIFYIHPFSAEKIKLLPQENSRKKNIFKLQEIEISDERFINLSNENYNLDFTDLFHTKDSNIMSDKILEDILINHEQKIISKIKSNNN
jgi:hypothetical protein